MNEFLTGDDWEIPVTIQKQKANFNASGATILAALILITATDRTQIIPNTNVTEVAGSDWANGLLIVEFSNAQTAITPGNYHLEVQVEKNGKKQSWVSPAPINVKKGTIS